VRIRILSYNIHRAIGMDRRFRLERVVSVLTHYQADLVLLQEVDEGAPRSRELDLAKELAQAANYPYYSVGYNVVLKKGQYGNATMSRFPILDERNIDLTIGSHKPRGCQYTRIDMRQAVGYSATLNIFNLHLGLSPRERVRQVGLLVNSSEFTSIDANQACLMAGDFNDWRGVLQSIFEGILGFQYATNSRGRRIRTYPSFSPRASLDKIFYRGNISNLVAHGCRLRVSRMASDHLPILADFELT
jgi:endonuclease/exonuclease/phosphatase family metal-dependent hydrolase